MQQTAELQSRAFHDICCGFWKRVARFMLRIIIRVLKTIVSIILGALMLVLIPLEIVLRIIRVIVGVLQLALQKLVDVINKFLGSDSVGTSKAIDIVAFLKWIYSVTFFRVWYMGGAVHQVDSPRHRVCTLDPALSFSA